MMRHQVVLAADANFDAWRDKARVLLAAGAAPEHVDWSSATEPGLSFDPVRDIDSSLPRPSRVPRQFVERARQAAMHRQFDRFALLYRILWRLTHHEPKLLELHVDADVVALNAMGKAVSRDLHKMKAFVRFKEIASQKDDGRTWFVAWFEPEHFIVPAAAPFFVGRFTNMRFSIVTPDASMHWDGEALAIGPGGRKSDVPAEDASEELWRTYYASIFNPARLKLDAMRAEMPQKYWKNLPEASLIAGLSNAAMRRTADMIDAPPAEPNHRVPVAPPAVTSPAVTTTAASKVLTQMGSIEDARQHLLYLTRQAAQCRSCELWRDATQTVFGEGPPNATVMLVGEQPGDQEDLAGHPFVGPAGQLLDRALIEAGGRSSAGLCHKRRQALQIRDARQTSVAPVSKDHRDRVVLALA